jgi:type IV secretory pathway VirB3-like protein
MPFVKGTSRRFDFKTKLFGMDISKAAYLGVGVCAAGLAMLSTSRLPLIQRVVLGLLIMAPAAAMAYVEPRGMSMDRALVTWLEYRRRPKELAWLKSFGEYVVEKGLAPPDAPIVSVDTAAVLTTVVVLLNLLVLTLLAMVTYYFIRDGLVELNRFLSG